MVLEAKIPNHQIRLRRNLNRSGKTLSSTNHDCHEKAKLNLRAIYNKQSGERLIVFPEINIEQSIKLLELFTTKQPGLGNQSDLAL